VEAFLKTVGLATQRQGLMQVDFVVPASLSGGAAPVVVTVNAIASPSAKLTIVPAGQ
jgi:uncharacterized protein (TIGR03437 family)